MEEGDTFSPLHKRAWVVQERLLSPRTLYYGLSGICWECWQQVATEGDPDSTSSDGRVNHMKLIMTYLPEALESEQDVMDFRNA